MLLVASAARLSHLLRLSRRGRSAKEREEAARILSGLGADDLGLLRYAVRLDSRYAVWAFAEGQHADLPSITLTNINR